MSVYARYKRRPEGFRALIELLETTPVVRRKKMIEVGLIEDPDYTEAALQYLMTFEDILALPDMELAELLAAAPPKMVAISICQASEAIQTRFLRNAQPKRAAQIRDYLEECARVSTAERGGAQLRVVESARALERGGKIQTKRIPLR